MKILVALLLAASLAAPARGRAAKVPSMASGTVQRTTSPFSIQLEAASPTVKAGEPVSVKIRLTNNSTRDLSMPVNDVNGIDANFQYEVRTEGGQRAQKAANSHPEIQIGSFRSRILKPGESTAWQEAPVSRIYDMSQAGQYVIQVFRPVSKDPKDEVVKSNPVTITVTP